MHENDLVNPFMCMCVPEALGLIFNHGTRIVRRLRNKEFEVSQSSGMRSMQRHTAIRSSREVASPSRCVAQRTTSRRCLGDFEDLDLGDRAFAY